MKNPSKWTARLSFVCYVAVFGGSVGASFVVAFILEAMKIDVLNLPYPAALFIFPITESVILLVTMLFARYKRASLRELGWKKASFRVLAIASVAAAPIFLLGLGINIFQTAVFGPDPMAELYLTLTKPKDFFQLAAMILINLVFVGPCQELAYRGFIQKGFENSFGKLKSLLITSILFGFWHILNSPYNVATAFAGGLVLGYVWQRTDGNTIVSALMHGVNNSISFAIVFFLA